MTEGMSSYGLWSLVVINSAVFIIFAFSFFKPRTKRDWRSFGAFCGFLIALFTEMYGFPLTIYLLSGWLQSRYPGVDWFAHDSGHLPEMLFGWQANPHFGPFHFLSILFIGAGFILISASWRVLYEAQRRGTIADWVRHSFILLGWHLRDLGPFEFFSLPLVLALFLPFVVPSLKKDVPPARAFLLLLRDRWRPGFQRRPRLQELGISRKCLKSHLAHLAIHKGELTPPP